MGADGLYDPWSSRPKLVQELDVALADADAGRISADPFEVKRARELTEKYGQPSG